LYSTPNLYKRNQAPHRNPKQYRRCAFYDSSGALRLIGKKIKFAKNAPPIFFALVPAVARLIGKKIKFAKNAPPIFFALVPAVASLRGI
jgi:hypothetical protein